MALFLQNAGYKVTIASPNGGKITIDKVSLQGEAITPDTRKWLDDGEALLFDCNQILRRTRITSSKNGVKALLFDRKQILRKTRIKSTKNGLTKLWTAWRSLPISITNNKASSGLDHWMRITIQIHDTTAWSIISYYRPLCSSWYCSMLSKIDSCIPCT